jgi:hypothetical protein
MNTIKLERSIRRWYFKNRYELIENTFAGILAAFMFMLWYILLVALGGN